MRYWIYIFAILTLLAACSPVRTRVSTKSKPTASKELADFSDSKKSAKDNKATAGKNEPSRPTTERQILKSFSDTTFLYVGEYRMPAQNQADKQSTNPVKSDRTEKAIQMFDSGEITAACKEISELLQSVSKDSEEFSEILFYAAECYIAKNAFEPARKILIELLSMDKLSSETKEKSLVRLGQIYCIDGKTDEAERLFKQLRREYPNSIYLQVANCEAIGS